MTFSSIKQIKDALQEGHTIYWRNNFSRVNRYTNKNIDVQSEVKGRITCRKLADVINQHGFADFYIGEDV